MSGPAPLVPPAEHVNHRNRPGSRLASVIFIHGLLVAGLAISAVALLADPCGGGGDLCLGGAVGLMGLVAAGVVLIGLAVRAIRGRSSVLVAIDSLLAVILGPSVFRGVISVSVNPAALFIIGVVVLAIAGAVLAAREVSGHRVERGILVVALIIIGVVFGLGRPDGGTVAVAIVAVVIGATLWPQPTAIAEAGPTED